MVYLLDGYYLAVLYRLNLLGSWGGDLLPDGAAAAPLLPRPRIKRGVGCGLLGLCFFVWFLYLAGMVYADNAYYACLLKSC